jgi:hypothetical protein
MFKSPQYLTARNPIPNGSASAFEEPAHTLRIQNLALYETFAFIFHFYICKKIKSFNLEEK